MSVHFSPTASYSRPPTSSESLYFNDFADHVFVCPDCSLKSSPYYLCPTGSSLAAHIVSRIYYSPARRTVYSSRDAELSDAGVLVPVQVEIPMGCEAVRTMLKLVERRRLQLQAQAQKQQQSYDRTYYIPPRRQLPPQQQQPRPSPTLAPVAVQYTVPSPVPQQVQPTKAPYYTMPLQYPAPLPMPARTRKRYSTSSPTLPTAFTYYPVPEQQQSPRVSQPDLYYGYYR